MERPFTGHSLPACRVNGTVMRGSSADTWVSVNMLTAISVPNGLTSSLSLAFSVFLLFSFSYALSLSVSLAPAILLWHCVSVKTFNRRWMRNPCVKGEGGRTQRERKRGQKGHVLPPALSLHSSLPLEGHVFVCFWMRDVWNVSYVRNEQHGHKYERRNTDRHTPLTLCSAQK